MIDDDMILLTGRMEGDLTPYEKDHFKDTIHGMPQWILTVPCHCEIPNKY